MITENGWPSCTSNQLDRSPIPGTDIVLPLQQGQPALVLKAFAADLNWYVESAYNSRGGADEGGWTGTNSVPTSNHLGGTAFDYNWTDHPMGPEAGNAAAGWKGSVIRPNQDEVPFIRELLDYYEGMVWWGNDWISPKDSMHFQMGYNTYKNPKVDDFINRKIDPATGFSRFRQYKQGGVSEPNYDATQLLSEALGDYDGVDYSQFVSSVAQCLNACECVTRQRISMWCAMISVESAGLRYMEEQNWSGGTQTDAQYFSKYDGRTDLGNINPGDGLRFKGRGPIQVTGRHNYTVLSKWAFEKGYVPTSTYFVDNPTELASPIYGFIGVIWYWTTQRPLNAASDSGNVSLATQYVTGGASGLADRKARYAACMNMGDRILNLLEGQDDWMSNPDIEKMIREIHAGLFNKITSQSRYKTDGEGSIWQLHELIKNDDGMVHESYVERLALLGNSEAIKLVCRNAAREDKIAQTVLFNISDNYLTYEQKQLKNGLAQNES
jgi:putative chitinase